MMVIAVGLSSYNIALFHLVNHAFYKGLLFLGAGAVIHAVADNQDFRKYGGLRPFLPLTYSVMLIASLSLVAFPFMTGFYSKDLILESAYGQFYFSGTVVYCIATIGAIFTTLYSVKVLYLTFLTNPNGPVVNYKHAHEGDIFMSLPLIILAIFSIFFGYITKDIFIGLGSGFFADNSLFIHPTHEIMLDTEFAVPTFFKLLPLFFTVSMSVLAIVLSEFLPKILLSFKFSRLGYIIFGFFNQRFLIELFYNKYITGLVLKLGGQTTKVLDKGSIELLGPFGLEKGLITLSRNIANLDTGVITSYALYILIGFIFYILIPYLSLADNSLLLLLLLALFSVINIYSNRKSKDITILEANIFSYYFSLTLKILNHNKLTRIGFILFTVSLRWLANPFIVYFSWIGLSICIHDVVLYFRLKNALFMDAGIGNSSAGNGASSPSNQVPGSPSPNQVIGSPSNQDTRRPSLPSGYIFCIYDVSVNQKMDELLYRLSSYNRYNDLRFKKSNFFTHIVGRDLTPFSDREKTYIVRCGNNTLGEGRVYIEDGPNGRGLMY
ncbi:related to NADH-ubiquinone oxidoreductase chain 5 [Rhynchosporium agropyri]|uniref:NADH-ubiquinone oxidoreductase chain 5 n=1 Tax=Rhynchosporium agropyri TaxID=914238 RepID=A0A1E1LVQ4_9HELO|nr:related to NADH-ubiquinone oxidoreductase chain 5 [Rhynchosporium agropyri]